MCSVGWLMVQWLLPPVKSFPLSFPLSLLFSDALDHSLIRVVGMFIRNHETVARACPGLANVNRETVRQMLKKATASPGAS